MRCSSGSLCGSDAACANEILVAHFPRHAERVQDVSFGRLATRTSFFDGMNRSRRNVGAFCEVVLGPTQGLSGGTNAIHGGYFSGPETGFGVDRSPTTIAPSAGSGAGHFLQVVDSQGAFRSSSCEWLEGWSSPRRRSPVGFCDRPSGGRSDLGSLCDGPALPAPKSGAYIRSMPDSVPSDVEAIFVSIGPDSFAGVDWRLRRVDSAEALRREDVSRSTSDRDASWVSPLCRSRYISGLPVD